MVGRMHGYDLLLQPSTPGAPLDIDQLEAAVLAQGATRRGDGGLSWTVDRQELGVRRLLEGGVCRALEVRVPYHERTTALEAAFPLVVAAAEQAGVIVSDPQLNHAVRLDNLASVVDAFRRASRYAGEMMGVSEAVGASFPPRTPLERAPARLFWLAALAFVIAVLVGMVLGRR